MKIIKDDFIYTTYTYKESNIPYSTEYCQCCDCYEIDNTYTELIETLKRKGLLSKEYLPRCCLCDYLLTNKHRLKYVNETHKKYILQVDNNCHSLYKSAKYVYRFMEMLDLI